MFSAIALNANAATQLATPVIAADWSFSPYSAVYIRTTANPDPNTWYYMIYRTTDTTGEPKTIGPVPGSGLSYYDSVPTMGLSYTYYAKAFPYDTVTYAASGDSNHDTAQTPPPNPTGFDISLCTSNSASLYMHLSWDRKSSGLDGYYVFRSTDGTNWSMIANPGAAADYIDDTGISRGATYHYAIYSHNSFSWSEERMEQSLEVPQDPIYFQLLSTTDLPAAIYDPAHGVNPNSRTKVGIGETATLNLSYLHDMDGGIEDTLGTPEWTVSDSWQAEIVSITNGGLTCKVRFLRSFYQADVRITATIDDAALYYDDPPVSNSITFNVTAPTECIAIRGSDVGTTHPYLLPPYDGYTASPSGEWIGSFRSFLIQVQPTSVNFQNVLFRENIPYQSFDFPNPAYHDVLSGGARPPFSLQYGNFAEDYVGAENAIAIAALKSGGMTSATTHTFQAPVEWQMESGYWHPAFTSNHQPRYFSATGTTTLSENGQSAPPDGPWIH